MTVHPLPVDTFENRTDHAAKEVAVVVRIALLCVVEIVIAVLLALQVFGGEAESGLPSPGVSIPADASPTAEESSDGRAPSRVAEPRAESRHEVSAKWAEDDPVGVLLMGTTRLSDGKSVDISISATSGDIRKRASSTDGSYALLGLHPGDWEISLRNSSIVESKHTVSITDDAVQYRDFVVDASIAVRVSIVTPDGNDATRAVRTSMRGWGDFFVAGQKDRFPDRLAPTDYGRVFVGDARWSREMNPKGGFAGTLHLASVPAHVALLQRHLVLEQKTVSPGQKELKFVVDLEALKKLAATATVRILDAVSGAPLTGAHVSLGTSNRGGGGSRVDAEGRAVVEGLSPGLLLCRIGAPERESYFHTVRVEPGQKLDLGDVRLGPPVLLTGTVLDPEGKPAGARLRWTELKWRTSPAEFAHNRVARTEADGSFKLWSTGRGLIAVQALGIDGLLAVGVFENPPPEPVVLRLVDSCKCHVTRPADPTRAFTLTLFDSQKRPIEARALEPRAQKSTLSMPAGTYTFEVHDGRELVQSGTLRFGTVPCNLEIR